MSPCNPNDVSVKIPDGPSGTAIPGFGIPFSMNLPNLNPFPAGFPENLLDLLNRLQLLIPPGALKAQLNPNFSKDVFDTIIKLLDQFMPFLMLYKFFLPILELIICIIEVLCSLMNPFKLTSALNRLFTQCIPAFLNLFPIFALIIMIISLLLLILALIEYIIAQIIKFVKAILRNVLALEKAFSDGDANGVLAIAKKLGSLLCMFQNLFVLFAIFNVIIQVIRDILSLVFAIPPCEEGDPGNQDGCCTPDVCPTIVKQNYNRYTGTFKYVGKAGFNSGIAIPGFGNLNYDLRAESWQMYDNGQNIAQQFRNIFDGYDVVILPKPVFFPTDSVYNSQTDPKQAPYVIDMRLFYNPAAWGRAGTARYIRFYDCIMTNVPTTTLTLSDLSTTNVNSGVAKLTGGHGFEDDGTILTGFAADGTTPIGDQAKLENFIHQKDLYSTNPVLSVNDGYVFSDVEYTFKPHIAPLFAKNIVTSGCVPSIAFNRAFINNIYASDITLKTQLLRQHLNDANFPNPDACQQCLSTSLAILSANMSASGVAEFQTTADLCLNKLKTDVNNSLGQLVGIGTDPCKSVLAATPLIQFTSKPIVVSVDLNEKNGLSITKSLSPEVATNIAARLKSHITFGNITNFSYDGYQSFTANLTSKTLGTGSILVSFDNNTLCTNILPPVGSSGTATPVHTLQEVNYQFVFTAPGSTIPLPAIGEGDTEGAQSRRNAGDTSRDNGQGGI